MCPTLISNLSKYYKNPRTLNLGKETLKDISSINVRTYLDNDNKIKSISYLESANASHIVYKDGRNLHRIDTSYDSPISLYINGKKHDNIVKRMLVPNEGVKYEKMEDNDPFTHGFVEIKNTGEVIITPSFKETLIQAPVKLFTKVFKSIKSIL
ncbi:MAG: hypothetical protein ACI4S3_03495 [Candidatus Gastranaerophilaceae bacterium]